MVLFVGFSEEAGEEEQGEAWQSGAHRYCWGGRLQSLPGTWSPSCIYHGHETLLAVAGEMALG